MMAPSVAPRSCEVRELLRTAALHQKPASAPLVMIVAAHPDDEVIGVGGQLAHWSERAVLVHVTDGAPPNDADARAAGFSSQAEYAAARRGELAAALSLLPHAPAATLRVGAVDQRVTHDLLNVVRALATIVSSVRPAAIVTHPYEGGHPDHDALAFAVASLRRSGLPFTHLEFACYHEAPGPALVTNRFTDCGRHTTRIVLDDDTRRRKQLMLAAFGSQQRTLQAFGADEEWIRPAPQYQFSAPPNDGRLWYERFNWGITGPEWRAAVADVERRLALEPLAC